MNTIFVQAATGLKLPKEGAPRTYVTDAAPVAVEGSHYYRKAIADGDLVELTEADYTARLAQPEAAPAKSAGKPVAAAA